MIAGGRERARKHVESHSGIGPSKALPSTSNSRRWVKGQNAACIDSSVPVIAASRGGGRGGGTADESMMSP